MADNFIGAKPSSWVQGTIGAATPFLLPRFGVVGVDYEPEELDQLRALAPHRVLLTPNHPTNIEPALLFHLSRAVRQPFLFMACRESFDQGFGLWGQLIRRVGAFSVVRGTADRASMKATREMLATPRAKMVVFPEGEVYGQNDSLLPFHGGVFQIAFWTLEDLKKAQIEEPLYILPIALKYRFTRPMEREIEASLARLEDFTGAGDAPPGTASYERLRRIGAAMLQSLEREYRLTPSKDAPNPDDLTPRLNAVKEAIVTRVASAAGLPTPKGESLPERMRALIYSVEELTRSDAEPAKGSPYDAALRRQKAERARPLLHDLRRLANWVAVYDGYVREETTPERMAETLIRLERECWGKATLSGPRRCRVRVGSPLDLRDKWADYEKNKRGTVAQVADEIESRVAALLGASAASSVSEASVEKL